MLKNIIKIDIHTCNDRLWNGFPNLDIFYIYTTNF